MRRLSILIRVGILLELVVLLVSGLGYIRNISGKEEEKFFSVSNGDVIKWVDFNISTESLNLAYRYDMDTYGEEVHIDWIDLLSYGACMGGGEFGKTSLKAMDTMAQELKDGRSVEELTEKLPYFSYYRKAYGAVLGSFLGKREDGTYGLLVYSPIAKDFYYSDYDDFGVSRSYGYKREHLGHDMMGQIGTPIICVESGTVEALGWNRYGGWRIGIRSKDKKRYYYYAHLRQNYPYQKGLEEGSEVQAGDVIGYMGHTGYSTKENVNNIDTVHLHFGMELIFDEERRKEGKEIWIDCYALTQFLKKNKAEVYKVTGTKEWKKKSLFNSAISY